MKKLSTEQTIKKVVDHFGGQYKLAGALDVSSVAVSVWVKNSRIPPRRALQIQTMTEGKFNAVELLGADL